MTPRLIKDNSQSAYREEVDHLAMWCNETNLLLNTNKTKELILDFSQPSTSAVCSVGEKL